MNWKESKLRIIVWITVVMLAETVLVLWPLGVVLMCTRGLSISVSAFVVVGLVGGLVSGLYTGLYDGLGIGLVSGLGGGLISGLGIDLVGDLGVGFVFSFVFGLGIGLVGGLVIGLIFDLVFDLVIGLVSGLIAGLSGGLVIGFVIGLSGGLVSGLIAGLSGGLGIFVGVPLGMLICHGFGELIKGSGKSIKQFFTPWRLGRLYFGRSVGFFLMLYLFFVLLFALWFYASYLNATKELPTMNPYFETQDMVATSNFWTFTYFSFITIASLGYGDIYPTYWFSQILVILETMVGVGLIAGFLAVIISVGGRSKRTIDEIDLDSDINY